MGFAPHFPPRGRLTEPGRDKRVKLALAEPDEVEPPNADHVEAVGRLLAPDYVLGLLVLDAIGAASAN